MSTIETQASKNYDLPLQVKDMSKVAAKKKSPKRSSIANGGNQKSSFIQQAVANSMDKTKISPKMNKTIQCKKSPNQSKLRRSPRLSPNPGNSTLIKTRSPKPTPSHPNKSCMSMNKRSSKKTRKP